MQKYQEKPELAIDKPQLLKQLKQAGGIDFSETPGVLQQMVNIGTLENMQVLLAGDLTRRLAGTNEE